MYRGKVREMWGMREFVGNKSKIREISVPINTERYSVGIYGQVTHKNGAYIGNLTFDEYFRLLKQHFKGLSFANRFIERTFLGYALE